MKRFLASCLCALVVTHANAVPAVVDYIIDGDTFAAAVNLSDDISITVRVRILDIDTPEINGDCDAEIDAAYRAKDKLAEILPVGNMVYLQNIKDDKYLGRIDASVILPDGRDVGRVMIKEGMARAYDGGRRRSWCD